LGDGQRTRGRSPCVVADADAREHPGGGAGEGGRIDPCALDRLPRHVEHEALLWVHGRPSPWGNPEDLGAKTGGPGREGPPTQRTQTVRKGAKSPPTFGGGSPDQAR